MKWTKRHSQNAVAAKARKRMNPDILVESYRRVRIPRRSRARFTIQIRDHKVGDSLTLNLHQSPWLNRWICEHGDFSSAHIGRSISLILQSG